MHTRLVTCDAGGSWISWGFTFLTSPSSSLDAGVRIGESDLLQLRPMRACLKHANVGSSSVLRLSMITRSSAAGGGSGGAVGSTLADSCVMSSGVMFAAASHVVAVPYAGVDCRDCH